MEVPDEVYKLVENSGNNFHAKVARWLSDNKWHVIVSPYYLDQTQNKAREIDLVAEKLWPVRDRVMREMGDIAVRLFIECKYVTSQSVFWFADKDQASARELVYASGPYREGNIYTNKHHYLTQSSKVAKLFATSASKAPENEPFYKALNQVLNAMVSMRGQPVSIPELKNSRWSPKALIEFPVVVSNSFDQIYSVDFYTESQPELIKDNFQLEIRYAYFDRHNNQRDDYFLLDFVEYSQLEKFAKAIDEDAKVAAFLVSL
ncbi:MAG: hypothetical protein F9K48_08930 [Candidatus Brocadia sp.]|nr:MAG: hypothetical protein F9K48_08930 [Candidatus Brocadia sp.]